MGSNAVQGARGVLPTLPHLGRAGGKAKQSSCDMQCWREPELTPAYT